MISADIYFARRQPDFRGAPHRTTNMDAESFRQPGRGENQLYAEVARHLPRTAHPAFQRGAGGGVPGRELRILPDSGKPSGENSGPGKKLDRGAGGRHSAAPGAANSRGGLVGEPHGLKAGGLGKTLL